MRRRTFLKGLLATTAAGLLVAGCANTATTTNVLSTLILELRVKGAFQLTNPNVFYYVVFDSSGNTTLGPRVFGPDPNIRPPRLEAILPFSASNLPGVAQLQSTWTDYFAFGGGSPFMQRGQLGSDSIVRVVDPQYTTQRWRLLDNNRTLELQVQFFDLRGQPGALTVNFASADARGFYYDRWAINSEFVVIPVSNTAPEIREQNFQPPYGLTTNELEAIKTLPAGVNGDDVDFESYRIRIVT